MRGSISTDTGAYPASSARPMTSGLSATNIAFAGSARFTELVFRQPRVNIQLRRVKIGDLMNFHVFSSLFVRIAVL